MGTHIFLLWRLDHAYTSSGRIRSYYQI